MSAIPNAEPVEVNSVPLPPIVADPGAHQPVVAPVVPNSTSGAKHTVTICKVPSCGRMALIFGHCRSHYNSLRCTYPRCKELQNGDTYCAAHERATAQRDQVRVKLESPLSGGAPHASEGATMHGYWSRQDNLHQDVPTEPTGALATPAPTSAGYGEAVDNFPSVSSAPETSTPSTVVPSAVAQIAAAIDTILEPVSPQENTVADETPPTSSETATTCGATASGYCGDHMPIPTKVVPSLCKTPNCLFRPKTNGFCQKHFIESRTTNSAPVVTSNQVPSQAASSPDAGSSQGGNRTEGTTNASSVSVPRILCKHLDCLQHAATDAEYCPVHKQLPNLFSSSTTPNTSQDSQGQSIPHSSTKLDTDPNTRNDNVKVCKVGGCVVSAKTQGFCRGHALTNQASVCDSAVPHIDNMPATCKAAGCSVVAKSKGYCRRHGNQIEQQAPQPPATVDLTSDDSPTTSVTANRTSYERCSVTGCRLKVKLNGMCRVHYYTPTMCQVSGCLFRSKMAGFCTIHAPASSK
ncbi:hypothetical protein DYB37_003832 [Aphanomyces astaci]|uniref:Uncharacterized protein n=1 Tax=Aphanomyces astaci TaxID=112090 RepID=A0A3R7AN40_APHAT|nr:hypothetical protein DYB35_005929 [Aphanomyces astaci]RHZ30674.1 hypothetical protein DYB37_003832 [Aphanomyces astaci]